MKYGDGGVRGGEEHGRGLSHNETPPKHRDALALKLYAVVGEYLHTGLRGARRKAVPAAGVYPRHRAGADSVDVLFGRYRGAGRQRVKPVRERAQEDDAVYAVIIVQRADTVHQLCLTDLARQRGEPHADAECAASPDHRAFIREIAVPLADTDYCKRGHDATGAELGCELGGFFVYFGGDRRAF